MVHFHCRRRRLLKSLEIAGFKSFAQPIRLEFPAGITALVGPNGSGKSNVVDAVRWCLGEQSMRDLRGQRSEDMIYAGARRLLGVSEVSLTLDVQSAPEISIARRLYRSGDSEYLVNGRRARLKDVLDVQLDLGIDPGRFVIVSQGMADELLSASAADRRSLLEQAAGLTSYRERRDEARQKLSTVQRNIETIELVLGELEPRLKGLRRQARAINDRDEAKGRLQERLLVWYGARWQALSRKATELTHEVESTGAGRIASAERLERLETDVELTLEREREWHDRLQAITAAVHLTERELDSSNHELEYLENRIVELQIATGERETNLARVQLRMRSVNDAVSDAEKQLQDLRRIEETHQRQRSQAQSALDAIRAAVTDATHLAEQSRRQRETETEQLSTLTHKIAKMRFILDQCTTRVEELHRMDGETQLSIEAALCDARTCNAVLAGAEDKERGAGLALEFISLQVNGEDVRIHRLERIVRQAELDYLETASALRSLERSIDHLLEQIGGELAQNLSVEAGWETAVSAGLGDWIHAGDQSTAILHKTLSRSFLEWRKSLADTFADPLLWADSVVSGFEEDTVNPLSATILVNHDEAACRIWQSLADLDAHRIGSPPVQVIGRSGKCWSALGVRSARQNDPATQLLHSKLSHRAEARRLEHRAARARTIEQNLSETRESHENLQRQRASAQDHFHDAITVRKEAANSAERAQLRCDALCEAQAKMGQELNALTSRMASVHDELTHLECEKSRVEVELTNIRVTAKKAENLVEARRSQLAAASERESAARRDCDVIDVKVESQESHVRLLRAQLDQLATEIHGLELARAPSVAEVERLKGEAASRRASREDLNAQLGEQLRSLHSLRERNVDERETKETLRKAREQHSQAVSAHEQALAATMQLEHELRQLAEEIHGEVAVEPAILPHDIQTPPTDDEIRKLRVRAVQYADLDLGVVQEYSDLQDRQQYLSSHLSDLRAAIDNLQTIIATADREMRDRFRAAFDSVNERFRWTFRTMLCGGDAQLEQTDDQGSVEVRAQLPGRRARTSAAYSGGERALVALALLFAILGHKPSPFCILDEVDAALDETNVDHYLALLREMSRQTQMLLVTHNRATMAAADVLYGLTLDDEGVSSLLSLRLDAFEPAI